MHHYDHDAGGPPELLERKADLRRRVWDALRTQGADRFPGAEGRIPNFTGAEDAAQRLRSTDEWKRSSTLKANPDSPQWPVRQRALEDGKVVYMAVPRLAEEDPFFLLDPETLETSPRRASSIKGAATAGRTLPVRELRPVDLVVVGCVAVSRSGARLGKGGGFSDLEYAVATEAGLIATTTPVVTTVHPLQVLEEDEIPMTGHDVPLDLIVTPDEVIRVEGSPPRPRGIIWGDLTEAKIDAIPLLGRLWHCEGRPSSGRGTGR
ncbi:MAG: 5-formyltetrahydrofolate cyclo-ligase [Gemmatimonadota bacterium]|jgi:5-formyltetrahydrofolate cyclo-ligase